MQTLQNKDFVATNISYVNLNSLFTFYIVLCYLNNVLQEKFGVKRKEGERLTIEKPQLILLLT